MIESKWKAGNKAYIITEVDGIKECDILNVSYTSYLMYNDAEFVMKISYKFIDEDITYASYDIVGEDEIEKRVFKTKEEAEERVNQNA